MQTLEVICRAIQQKRLLSFQYDGYFRIVEPQIVGLNNKGNMVLSAWQVGGYTHSGTRYSWRDYRISKLSQVKSQAVTFDGPRPGYVKGGGRKFSRIFCELMEDLRAN